jgi:hypothetical protein
MSAHNRFRVTVVANTMIVLLLSKRREQLLILRTVAERKCVELSFLTKGEIQNESKVMLNRRKDERRLIFYKETMRHEEK